MSDKKRGILILETLEGKVSMDQMIESALLLYVPCENVDAHRNMREIQKRLKETIIHQCTDLNVQLLISAAIFLDKKVEEEGIRDHPLIISDELIGIVIAEYIGGKKALFNFMRYDTEKPGILSKLGIFLDDAVGGLIAGCMTKLFEEWK